MTDESRRQWLNRILSNPKMATVPDALRYIAHVKEINRYMRTVTYRNADESMIKRCQRQLHVIRTFLDENHHLKFKVGERALDLGRLIDNLDYRCHRLLIGRVFICRYDSE